MRGKRFRRSSRFPEKTHRVSGGFKAAWYKAAFSMFQGSLVRISLSYLTPYEINSTGSGDAGWRKKAGALPGKLARGVYRPLFLMTSSRLRPFFLSRSFLFPFVYTHSYPFVCTFLLSPFCFLFCFLFCAPLYILFLLCRKSQNLRPAATSYYKQKLPISSRQNGRVRRRRRFPFWRGFCLVVGRLCSYKGVDAKIGATPCQSVM